MNKMDAMNLRYVANLRLKKLKPYKQGLFIWYKKKDMVIFMKQQIRLCDTIIAMHNLLEGEK